VAVFWALSAAANLPSTKAFTVFAMVLAKAQSWLYLGAAFCKPFTQLIFMYKIKSL